MLRIRLILTIDPTVAKAKDADAETDGADPAEAPLLMNLFPRLSFLLDPLPDLLEPLPLPDFLAAAVVVGVTVGVVVGVVTSGVSVVDELEVLELVLVEVQRKSSPSSWSRRSRARRQPKAEAGAGGCGGASATTSDTAAVTMAKMTTTLPKNCERTMI